MMDKSRFSRPVAPACAAIRDEFFFRAMELVRREVIPYQWETLNDRVKDAAPSFCMHNFRAAARMNGRRRAQGAAFEEPRYVFRKFETLPQDPDRPDEDSFYGYVFQDSDFYKWIEAVGWSLAAHPDAQLEALADGAIDVICAAQLENGYLDTYYILNGMDGALTNLRDHHELYCLGHLIEAAIAYREGTGKEKLLGAACRFADYIDARIGDQPGKLRGYPGHEVAELALIRLSEVTGEARYLRLAEFFLNERGQAPNYFIQEEKTRAAKAGAAPAALTTDPAYHQAHQPVREQSEAAGHAVRAVYLYSGMADAARVTGEEALLAACRRLWADIEEKKLYITGGIGGTHEGEAFSYAYDLPGDAAYSETCAAIGLVFFARRMLQIDPDSRYGDVMELALYNTVSAGMALDGKSFFYVNPLSVVPQACRQDKRLRHVKPVRQKWFGCACCPPNIARLLSSISQYAFTQGEDVFFIHLYVGAAVKARLGGGEATLHIQARMPWEGRVRIRVETAAPVCGTIALRIPGWTQGPTLRAPDKRQETRSGYLYLSGEWRDGEEIGLDFPMPVHMVQADPRVRECIGQVAFMRGPVVFCAEEADNGPQLHLLRVDREAVGADCEGVQTVMEARFGHPTAALLVPGRRTALQAAGRLYAKAAPAGEEDAAIRLIPYYAWANRGEGEMRVWLR